MIGYEEWSPQPLRRREVAQAEVTLIFNLGPPLLVGGAETPLRPRGSFIAGRLDLYGITEFEGHSRGLELDMTPFGAHAFLGVPLHELTEVVVPVEDVLGNAGRDLVDRLSAAPDWEGRFELLARAIATRVTAGPVPSPDALHAWLRLQGTAGRASIGSLTRELGCSRRHLNARFREQVGVSPKTAARVIRFRRCVGMLERDDGRRFAEIATACGYYDQAHMNREFRALAGSSPGDFVASRLPAGRGTAAEPQVTSVQDAWSVAA